MIDGTRMNRSFGASRLAAKLAVAAERAKHSIALSYKGRCGVFWFFGGEGRPCPLREYMKEELAFALIPLIEFWWLILPAFLVIPGIGYLFGRRRHSFNST